MAVRTAVKQIVLTSSIIVLESSPSEPAWDQFPGDKIARGDTIKYLTDRYLLSVTHVERAVSEFVEEHTLPFRLVRIDTSFVSTP